MLKPRHILVVENDSATRDAVALLLRQHGYQVSTADNGAEALNRLGSGPRPALIILDLMLPVMDGWAFRATQLADPELSPIPLLVCSSVADLAGHAALLRAAALLSKPVEFTQLAQTVRSLAGPCLPEVLVVDDDPHVRRVMELTLVREGLTIRSASCGIEAVTLYRQHQDSIGVVLLDVRMSGGDGPWTLAALRQINPTVRAAFVSAGGDDPEALLGLGVAAVLQKPFDLRELAHTVEQILTS
jgi:CheY-like chemotaxis protein